MRGKAAIVGIGETTYYKHGQSPDPEVKLVLDAIQLAAEDAGIDVREIDGFASYADDRNDPSRLMTALGSPDLTFSNMVWGGGGGGGSGAVANAVAAVVAGYSKYVVVYRGLAQGQFGRFGQGPQTPTAPGPGAFTAPYGLLSPAQSFAMRIRRFMHDHGAEQSALRAISMATYRHAQSNPRAVMYGRELTERDVRQLAHDRGAVPPVRLLPGERRGGGADRDERRAREGHEAEAGLGAERGPGGRTTGRRRRRTTRPTTRPRTSRRWRRGCTRWRAWVRRTWTCSRATRTSPAGCS